MMVNAPRTIDPTIVAKLRDRLRTLYGDDAEHCLARLLQLIEKHRPRLPEVSRNRWDERDVVLITYGDQIQQAGQPHLQTLAEFLSAQQLDELIRTIHILPFYPSTSDDGFSVSDYRAVDPALGDWNDIGRLGQRFDLMFDLVLNHASSQCRWFREYLVGREPYTRYFIEADPHADLSAVTRPRSLPLLTAVDTSRGTRHVWTTFSADQIDLNFANPDVLCEMTDVVLFYIEQGARILRLDAVAYLWKQLGTNCIHLPQTHQVVRLLRDLIDAVAPHVLLLTETNVPHAENISYLGRGDEAHMVYQFSLPPLILDAMLSGDARPLVAWLSALQPAPPGTTFFNFTASHDGIGVRPLEGLVADDRVSRLVEAVKARGGLVSTRRRPDATEGPYELNISYVSALGAPGQTDVDAHVRRFLTSQGLMLALRGMPAVYVHSLLGSANDEEGLRRGGQPRRINRRKFQLRELTRQLADAGSLEARIFSGYRSLLSIRTRQPAFHPDAEQSVWPLDEPWLVAFLRTSVDEQQSVLVLANVSDQRQELELSRFGSMRFGRDLLTARRPESQRRIALAPWELVWFEVR